MSGMGLATAKMLLGGGARVLVTGRSAVGLESAQKELGESAIVLPSDTRSLTDIDALATQVKAVFDTFDFLFVNAGFSIQAPPGNVTEAVYDEMFNLNAKGPFFAVQTLAPLINRGGSVVFTASIANARRWTNAALRILERFSKPIRRDARYTRVLNEANIGRVLRRPIRL